MIATFLIVIIMIAPAMRKKKEAAYEVHGA